MTKSQYVDSYIRDISKVEDVITSCLSIEHTRNADKMVSHLKNKWSSFMSVIPNYCMNDDIIKLGNQIKAKQISLKS